MFIRWIVKGSLSEDESHVIVGGTALNTPSDHISLSCKGCCLWMAESHTWHIYCDAPHWWHLILGLWSPHLKQAYIWSDNSLLITLRMFSYTILSWWSAYCISGQGRVHNHFLKKSTSECLPVLFTKLHTFMPLTLNSGSGSFNIL